KLKTETGGGMAGVHARRHQKTRDARHGAADGVNGNQKLGGRQAGITERPAISAEREDVGAETRMIQETMKDEVGDRADNDRQRQAEWRRQIDFADAARDTDDALAVAGDQRQSLRHAERSERRDKRRDIQPGDEVS